MPTAGRFRCPVGSALSEAENKSFFLLVLCLFSFRFCFYALDLFNNQFLCDFLSVVGELYHIHTRIEVSAEFGRVYQTSGNIAVTDDEALKFAEVCNDFVGDDESKINFQSAIDFLNNKTENQVDSPEVRRLKGLIRRRESFAAVRYIGLKDENTHFLDMPFYETGQVKKNPIGEEDINLVMDIIAKIKPHQIFAAGDLADPHGTHEVCLNAIFAALKKLKPKPYMDECWLWLYRGAWHEWDLHEIDMAVPLSPDEVTLKRHAILYHQSQKDRVMFQGSDPREFWVRAEDRNKHTAKLYDDLGLAEYEAIEAFKRFEY